MLLNKFRVYTEQNKKGKSGERKVLEEPKKPPRRPCGPCSLPVLLGGLAQSSACNGHVRSAHDTGMRVCVDHMVPDWLLDCVGS